MPTRYQLDVDLKNCVTSDVMDNSTKKVAASKVRFKGLGLGVSAAAVEQQQRSSGGAVWRPARVLLVDQSVSAIGVACGCGRQPCVASARLAALISSLGLFTLAGCQEAHGGEVQDG